MTTYRVIEFENNSPKVCYSGKLLKGHAKIYFPVDTNVKDIYITFCGKGFCQWSKKSERITGSKTYFDVRVDLVPNNSNADIVVPSGNNTYPFEIQLPSRLPTSYEGTYGYIRYCAILHINRSAKKLNPLNEVFTVIQSLNLSNHPSYQAPMEVRKFTKFNQFCLLSCWKSDELQIFGRIPVRGYCPGQTINLQLDVINKSGQNVLYFLVEFIQEVVYTANNGEQNVQQIKLCRTKTEGCRGNLTGIQTVRVNTLVPSLPPTNFSADICLSRYMFVVTAQTSMYHTNPMFEIPIVIGTYPISNELFALQNNERSHTNRITPSAPFDEYLNRSNISINSTDVPPYPDEDPPTYEEAMRSDVASTGRGDFLPKYPTYRRPTTYAIEDI